MTTIEVPFNDPGINPIVRAAFPGETSRRTVKVQAKSEYRIKDYWDGGSRDYCSIVKLDTLQAISATELPAEMRETHANPYNLPVCTVKLSPGIAIVEHVIFCGKDLGFRVYLHSENIAPMLVAKPADVTEREANILARFRAIKAGPYRRDALAAMQVTDAEVDALVTRGFLKRSSNGATALTIEGRQVCTNIKVY